MMLKLIPASVQRWFTILLPPVALLVCCWAMVPRQNKLQDLRRQIRTAERGIRDYTIKLKAISDLPPDPRIATLPMTKQEQSDFLRGLSGLCIRTGNRIMSVSSLAALPPPPPPPPGSPASAPPPAGALPPDVVEIKSTISFEGNFTSLRAFLYGLHRSRRLISMGECRIGLGQGGYPNLSTTLTITRYVDAPIATSPSPAPPAPPAKS
jgi:hypothetical protein